MTAENTIGTGAFKLLTDHHALVKGAVTLDEFRQTIAKEFKRVHMNMARFGAGTPTRKRVWASGRPRRVCPDGRLLHVTKGFAITERGGYQKRSRRSNTSRT